MYLLNYSYSFSIFSVPWTVTVHNQKSTHPHWTAIEFGIHEVINETKQWGNCRVHQKATATFNYSAGKRFLKSKAREQWPLKLGVGIIQMFTKLNGTEITSKNSGV